jgi:hypothetical protein
VNVRRVVASFALVAASAGCAPKKPTAVTAPPRPRAEGQTKYSYIFDPGNPALGLPEDVQFRRPLPKETKALPTYPEQALEALDGPHREVVRFVIDTHGNVDKVVDSPIEPSDGGPFAADYRRAVEEALRSWRFEPGVFSAREARRRQGRRREARLQDHDLVGSRTRLLRRPIHLRDRGRQGYRKDRFHDVADFADSAGPGVMLAGTVADASDLERTLTRLARVAELYRDTALGFACQETIAYSGRATGRIQFAYLFIRDENGRLRDFRTWKMGTTAKERGREVHPEDYRVPAFLESAYLWAFTFRADRQPLFQFERLGDESVDGRAGRRHSVRAPGADPEEAQRLGRLRLDRSRDLANPQSRGVLTRRLESENAAEVRYRQRAPTLRHRADRHGFRLREERHAFPIACRAHDDSSFGRIRKQRGTSCENRRSRR